MSASHPKALTGPLLDGLLCKVNIFSSYKQIFFHNSDDVESTGKCEITKVFCKIRFSGLNVKFFFLVALWFMNSIPLSVVMVMNIFENYFGYAVYLRMNLQMSDFIVNFA